MQINIHLYIIKCGFLFFNVILYKYSFYSVISTVTEHTQNVILVSPREWYWDV